MKYLVEHLEPELYEWCILEYKSISDIVGKDNLILANINKKDIPKLKDFAEIKTESAKNLNLKNSCLLDMSAEKELSPEDNFDFLIFGGILGDDPPKERTKKFFEGIKIEKKAFGKNADAYRQCSLHSKINH